MASETSPFYKYSAATQALFIWGGWSYYVNSRVSIPSGITSGLAQGVASFCLTLIVVFLVTKIFNYFENRFFKVLLPTTIVVCILVIFLLCLHTLVGTPKILQTIAPPLLMALMFCSFTTYKLRCEKAY